MLKRVLVTTLSSSLVLGLLIAGGCDGDQQKADRAVQERLDKAEQARGRANVDPDPETVANNLKSLQDEYDSIAMEQGLSDPMRIVVHSRQAQVRLQRTVKMMSDLRNAELAIMHKINDIEQLGLQVNGA